MTRPRHKNHSLHSGHPGKPRSKSRQKSRAAAGETHTKAVSGKASVEPITSSDEPKVGRNDPCPCESGKKHKKCCLGREET